MARDDLHPTKHVIEKMNARNITWGEIIDTVDHSEVVYGPDPEGIMIHQKGDIAVVVGRGGSIVTVLLRSEKKWNDMQAQVRQTAPARTYRRPQPRKPKSRSHYKRKKRNQG